MLEAFHPFFKNVSVDLVAVRGLFLRIVVGRRIPTHIAFLADRGWIGHLISRVQVCLAALLPLVVPVFTCLVPTSDVGLTADGIGLALRGTQRRWLAIAGMLTGAVSASLPVYWHRFAILDASWLWLIGIGCSTGLLYGAVAFVWRTSVLPRARRHGE